MPGTLPAPAGTGSARRWKRAASTCTLSACESWPVGDCAQGVAHRLEVIQPFVEAEVLEVVAQRFQAQEGGELLVHADHRVLGVGAQDVMAVVDAFQHAGQLAGQAAMQAPAEDLRDPIAAQPHQAQVAGALEQFVDGKVAPEDENCGNTPPAAASM